MKMGDDKGALKFALKKSNIEAFRVSSSCGAWFWTKALLDYRYKKQTGFAEDYFDASNSDDPESKNLFNNFEGTILRAFQASPETLRFLTGERKLPNCRVPYHMGNWASLSNVGIYCLSNAELWRNTPGALEWAARNVRTLMCSLILNQDLECCKTLNIKCSTSQFEELLSQGIFLDAKVSNNGRHSGKTLVHVATCNEKPQLLRMLLNAGAEVKTSRIGRGIPPPLHMSCYYNFSPKIIKILCNAGMHAIIRDNLLSLLVAIRAFKVIISHSCFKVFHLISKHHGCCKKYSAMRHPLSVRKLDETLSLMLDILLQEGNDIFFIKECRMFGTYMYALTCIQSKLSERTLL